MKNKKKNKFNPRQYWKDKIGFDSEEELLIYQYLCGNIKKKKAKQLDKAKKFQEYKTWRKHVEEYLEKCDTYELEEFYRFAKSNARISDNGMRIYIYFGLPLAASLIGSAFIPCLFDLASNEDLIIQQYTVWESVALFIIYFLVICIYFLAITWFAFVFLKRYINAKNNTIFWEDCLEIIENKIREANDETP